MAAKGFAKSLLFLAVCITNMSYLAHAGVFESVAEVDSVAMVNAHNQLRSTIQASNMQEMRWSPALAQLAQSWANRCTFQHSTYEQRRSIGPFGYVGENIYVWSVKETGNSIDVNRVTGSWWKEVQDYSYGKEGDAGTCSTTCGHFTQMAWAQTCAVGCAAANCKTIDGFNGAFGGSIVVCNYGPGGNVIGDYAWKKGAACQSCPQSCTGGLCPAKEQLCPSTSSVNAAFSPSPQPPATQPTTVTKATPFPTVAQRITFSPQTCKDEEPQCAFWADVGYCRTSSVYMRIHCPHSCKVCNEKKTPTSSVEPPLKLLLSSSAANLSKSSAIFVQRTAPQLSTPSPTKKTEQPSGVPLTAFRKLQDPCIRNLECGLNAFCTGTQFGLVLKHQCMCRLAYKKVDSSSCTKDPSWCDRQLDCPTPGQVCCRTYLCDAPIPFTQRCQSSVDCDKQTSSCRLRPRSSVRV